jgi:hypothetical protein
MGEDMGEAVYLIHGIQEQVIHTDMGFLYVLAIIVLYLFALYVTA